MFIIKRSLRRNKQLSHRALLRFWFVKKLITPIERWTMKIAQSFCLYKSIKPNYVLKGPLIIIQLIIYLGLFFHDLLFIECIWILIQLEKDLAREDLFKEEEAFEGEMVVLPPAPHIHTLALDFSQPEYNETMKFWGKIIFSLGFYARTS